MNFARFTAAWAVFLGSVSLAVYAQESSSGQSTTTKTLRVMVIEAGTEQPVVGAVVSVFGPERIKLTTDAAGVAVLRIAASGPVPEQDSMFSFLIQSSQHEARQVEWFSDKGRVRETLPAEYKVRLLKGVTAGGVVRDERGAPIAGARVTVFASGLRGRRLGGGERLQQDYGCVSVAEGEEIVTDAQGRWSRDRFPTEISQLSVNIIRPEGAHARFISGAMYRGPNERAATVDVDALLKQSAVFTLKDGITVRGVVVDEAGRPIGGAQLRARDAGSRNPPYAFFSQPDGTFALQHWDVSSVLVTAEKEGYQATSATLAAGGDAAPGKITLLPARPLRVRVVGENDTPLAGAEILTDRNPAPDQIVSWTARTDDHGRAEWPTAPGKPVTLWITPPAGSAYPFRSARLLADGSEHVIRVRPGADKAVTVRVRAVDAVTGTPVPRFELWRRLGGQPFKPWGMPADGGEITRELASAELPNGIVPQYRLQVRAAGYTGWASDSLDFSFGDQDLTIKLVKGESTLANEPPPRGGRGIDGEQDPKLIEFGASVARFLETGDQAALLQAIGPSFEEWKRLLPAGASEKDVPLGPNPERVLQTMEKFVATSAARVLTLAAQAGVKPGSMRFTVKSVSSPMNASSSIQIANQPMTMPSARALRIVLVGEPIGAGGDALRGEYVLGTGEVRKFPGGWRTDAGLRWIAFPSAVGDDAMRHELSLVNRISPMTFSDARTLSGADDPALLRLGTLILGLVRERSATDFVAAARLTRDETFDFYRRTDRVVTPEVEESYARNSSNLTAAAQALVSLQERTGIDLGDARLTIKQVLAENASPMRFGQADGITARTVRITFSAETNRLAKSGQPLAGDYTVAIGNTMRIADRWIFVDDKIRFQAFPPGVMTDEAIKQTDLENYVAEHRALPPGHRAPDVSFVKLSDNSPVKLSDYRGKIVVLEFWAVWCGPCQEPMEKLQHLREASPDWKDRVEIIALSIDEKADEARSHLEKKGWSKTFNVWAGEGAWQAPAPKAFRVSGVPTVYLLDREGRVIKAGHPATLDLPRLIDHALHQPAQ